MFSKKENTFASNPAVFDTLVGKNANFSGNLESAGLVRIEGNITGDIKIEGNLVIGKDSVIVGNIKAANIEIYGSVNGNVNADDSLTLYESSSLSGDIEVKNLIIKENASFIGHCKTKAYTEKNGTASAASGSEFKKQNEDKNKSKETA